MEKKDFDPDPSTVGSSTEEGSDEAGQPRRRKRSGLRVPSDNVPRPTVRESGRIPVLADGVAAPSALTPDATPPPSPPPGAQSSAPLPAPEASDPSLPALSGPAAEREDLEVEVEMEVTPPPQPRPRPPSNGSGPVAAVAPRAVSAEEASDGVPLPTSAEPPAPPAPRAATPAPEPSFQPIGDDDEDEIEISADEDGDDEYRGEPTQITPPPSAPPSFTAAASEPPAAAPQPAEPAAAAPAAPAPAAPAAALDGSRSGPVARPTPSASPPPASLAAAFAPLGRAEESSPTETAGAPAASADSETGDADAEPVIEAELLAEADAARAATDEPEELSPTELEEVESGPQTAATAPLATRPASTPPTPSPAAAKPGSVPPVGPPPGGPPATPAVARQAPPPPPPAAKAAAAVAAAAAQQPAQKPKKRKGKAWFEEIFDEDYLRTLPFLTPQATQREAGFIAESLLLKPGMQVLDLGCGYGRHAMELAARGYHVVGLDLSLPLLIRGADEAQRRGLNINFVHGDMRELTFDAQFDGAYCVFSTFGYFDDETNKRVAANLARALKPGGRLVIDVLNRDYVIGDLPTRVWWEGDGCVVLEEVDFNYFTSRVISSRSVVFEDGRQLEQEISIRTYSLHELGKLLHGAGFRVLEVSGGLATRGRFFGTESRQIIVVAERRADIGAGTPTSSGSPTQPPPLGAPGS